MSQIKQMMSRTSKTFLKEMEWENVPSTFMIDDILV